MVDNLAPDVDIILNTNYMEQRVLNSQQAYPSTSMALPSSIEQEMSDGNWMALEQLKKPIQLGTVVWTTEQARNTSIFSASIPESLVTIESLLIRTLRMYAFYKLSPSFKVQINATQFHQGQLICSFDPFSFTQLSEDVLNIFTATGLPNVKIMASESEPVELNVPFIHPRSYLTTNVNTFDNLGYFDIRVLNPLRVAGDSSPSLNVTIWLRGVESSVHVPIYDHAPIFTPSLVEIEATSDLSKDNRKSANKNINRDVQQQQLENLSNNGPSGWQQIKDTVATGGEILGNLLTGNIGQALRKGQGLIDNLGKFFGFDYPCRTIQPDKTISPVENMAVGIGKSQSQRLAIDPFSMHILQDDIASESLQSMDFLSIAKIPMLYTQFLLSTSSTAKTLLRSWPIHPVVCASYAGSTQRTFLSFITNAFTYWSGGIVYDVEIVATHFHSGKLLFCYIPNDLELDPGVTYDTLVGSVPLCVVDIQQTSNTSFKIPFTSPTPMKSTMFSDALESDAAMGTLLCFVQNALTVASNAPSAIEINIYISAADDYSLYVPRRPIYNAQAPAEVEATAGVGIIGSTNLPSQTSAVLSKDQDISIPRSHFGEDYSPRDILKRFSFLGRITLNKSLNFNQITPFSVSPHEVFISSTENAYNEFSFLYYFSRIYSAWTGSIRYKFVTAEPRTSNVSLDVFHLPDPNANTIDFGNTALANFSANGYGRCRTNLSQDNALELEIPFYSKYNVLLTRSLASGDTALDINGELYPVAYSDSASIAVTTDLYIAAGEDFRFIYLRAPPTENNPQNILYQIFTLP